MDIWNTTYSARDVAAAADIAPATLQNWLKRDLIVGHRGDDIEGGGVQGKSRRFSFFAVMQISIAAALIKASGGMDIKQAFEAARSFAHSNDGGVSGEWVNDDAISEDLLTRHPGMPFYTAHGDTLFACAEGKTTVVLHRPGEDALAQIRTNLRGAQGFTLIDAGSVFDRVCAADGLNPMDVLDAAYADHSEG